MKNGLEIDADGIKYWYKDDLLHREDGPALEYPSGGKSWFQNGLCHREDGPAVEYANGSKLWFQDGEKHREDGPAVEWFATGDKEWYYQGKRIDCSSQEEFEKIIKLKAFW